MIRKFWLNRVFEKELDKRLSSKSLKESFKVKKIAILVDAETNIESEFFLSLAKDFNIPEIQISMLLFSVKSDLDKQYQEIFNPEDVSYWSSFKGDLLLFCKTEYDILINYHSKFDTMFSLVSTRINHKLSVGFSGADSRINDIIFDFGVDQKETFRKELVKYMNILNKL